MMKFSLLLAALLLLPAAHANADSPDNQYLHAVSALGITTAQPDQLIAGAHTLCDGLGTGWNLFPAEGQLLSAGVPYGQLTQVFTAAGRAYCPDKMHSVGLS
jgi:hypothetical protein